VAQALFQQGNKVQATRVANQAVSTFKAMERKEDKTFLSGGISLTLAQAGLFDHSQQVLNIAFNTADCMGVNIFSKHCSIVQ